MKRSMFVLATVAAMVLSSTALAQGRGRGSNGCGGAGPDMAAVATVIGTVVSFDGRAGAGTPALVLSTGAGELEIAVGSYRVASDSGLSLAAGDELEVVYAPVGGTDHLVAISITDLATGFTVQMRDPETGFPLTGGRGGRGGRGGGRNR